MTNQPTPPNGNQPPSPYMSPGPPGAYHLPTPGPYQPPSGPSYGPPTAPQYGQPQEAPGKSSRLHRPSRMTVLTIAVFAALIAVGLVLYLIIMLKANTVTRGSYRKLQAQVTSLSNQLGQATRTEANDHNKDLDEFKGIGQDLIPLVQYSRVVCSSDFTGPNGPTQYWFLCTDKKPASSAG